MSSVSQPFHLLRTKLYPPEVGGQPRLPRQALIDRLWEARERRVLVLSAPAGFGKSTVLSLFREALQREGARVAWLSCDESDSEPQRLLQYLVAAVEAVIPGFGANTAGLLCGEVNWPVEAIIDAFVSDLQRLEGELYLMLDDFHRIRHASLEQGARHLVERLPRNVHLISSTRFTPRSLFVENEAFMLQAEDLRLSLEETEAYFRDVRPLELSRSELKQLHARTEGWITALHLASLALARHPDRTAFLASLSGTERNIADYLAEDVVNSLPVTLQQFLDQTSVLDEFCADLCNALTGRRDGLDMLMRLQREQLFVIALTSRASGSATTTCSPSSSRGAWRDTATARPCCTPPPAGAKAMTCPTGPSSTPCAGAISALLPSCWSARGRGSLPATGSTASSPCSRTCRRR